MATAPDPLKLVAEQRAESLRNLRVVLGVGDVEYTLRFGDVTARDVRELRAAGFSVGEVIAGAQGTVAELDRFAAAVWLARRQAGETVSFADVEASLRLDVAVSFREEDSAEPVEAYPDPPLSGGS